MVNRARSCTRRSLYCQQKKYIKTNVNLELQSVTTKDSFGFPSQHGAFSSLNKQYRMLCARTQADDHGHPRAFAFAGLSELSTLEDIHRTNVSWKSKPSPLRGH